MTAVHDRHVEGLFSRRTWERVLASAGYTVATTHRPIGDGEFDDVFLCKRAGTAERKQRLTALTVWGGGLSPAMPLTRVSTRCSRHAAGSLVRPVCTATAG